MTAKTTKDVKLDWPFNGFPIVDISPGLVVKPTDAQTEAKLQRIGEALGKAMTRDTWVNNFQMEYEAPPYAQVVSEMPRRYLSPAERHHAELPMTPSPITPPRSIWDPPILCPAVLDHMIDQGIPPRSISEAEQIEQRIQERSRPLDSQNLGIQSQWLHEQTELEEWVQCHHITHLLRGVKIKYQQWGEPPKLEIVYIDSTIRLTTEKLNNVWYFHLEVINTDFPTIKIELIPFQNYHYLETYLKGILLLLNPGRTVTLKDSPFGGILL